MGQSISNIDQVVGGDTYPNYDQGYMAFGRKNWGFFGADECTTTMNAMTTNYDDHILFAGKSKNKALLGDTGCSTTNIKSVGPK